MLTLKKEKEVTSLQRKLFLFMGAAPLERFCIRDKAKHGAFFRNERYVNALTFEVLKVLMYGRSVAQAHYCLHVPRSLTSL